MRYKPKRNQPRDDSLVILNGLIHHKYGKLLSKHKQNDQAKKQFYSALKIKPCLPNIHDDTNEELKKLDNKHNPNDYRYESSDEINEIDHEHHIQPAKPEIPFTGDSAGGSGNTH